MLHADRIRLTRMASAARKAVEESFSLRRMGADYNRFFNFVIAIPSPELLHCHGRRLRLPGVSPIDAIPYTTAHCQYDQKNYISSIGAQMRGWFKQYFNTIIMKSADK